MQRGAVYQPWPTPTEANPGLHELKYFDFGGSLASCCCWFFSQSWRKAKWSQVWKVSPIMGFFCFSRKSWMQKTPFPVPTSNQSAVHIHTHRHSFWSVLVCGGWCMCRLHTPFAYALHNQICTQTRYYKSNIRGEYSRVSNRLHASKTRQNFAWCLVWLHHKSSTTSDLSDLVFADGDRSVGYIEGHRSPVVSAGRTDQTVYSSIQYIHAWCRRW